MKRKIRTRLSVDIPEDLYRRLLKVLPWGTQTKIVQLLLYDLVELLEKEPKALALLLTKYTKPREVIKTLEKINEIRRSEAIDNSDE